MRRYLCNSVIIMMLVAVVLFSSRRGVSVVAKNVSVKGEMVTPGLARMSSETSVKVASNGKRSETFKYFAFGSNLLEKRMHYNNPKAKRFDIGLLEGYRLDFGSYTSKRWGGYVASVVPDVGKRVWGAIWDVDLENLDSLDRQEGVQLSIYKPINVTVATPSGQLVKCRCYTLVNQPAPQKVPGVPNELPSKVYLNTIIKGARESQLPQEYIQHLESLPHNGYDGPVNLDSE